ncbi:hypothetical protein TTHERM_00556700 (macronuclear) [Tetrahymena thermophila SB210]|uniref:Uncharacterized protein n=1 Tax=Tetrahymena thermophila (strain SB210) TaxID=312017 RepID=I7LWL0_TETTS|nr:hypothetical protein TTHERM_00556700 [Tetrahymena thermophila SB210]EAS02088.2 hypothetical protein TTHERM_00556700 [Tetrahymena thermophila SB210]|eukprot:XP_001022333.2 hypothetical protein TTHERM_00556700 [Tetrahymena thermophila SB210]
MKNNTTRKKRYFKVELNKNEPLQPKYPNLDSKNKTKAQCEKELKIYDEENKEYLEKMTKYKTILNTFYKDLFDNYNEEDYDALKNLSQFDESQAKLNVCFWFCCDELACSIDYRNLFYQMKCSTPQQNTKSLDNFKYQQKVYDKSKQLSLRIIKYNDLFSIKQKQGTKLILFHFVALQKKKKIKNIQSSDSDLDQSHSDSLNIKRPRFLKKKKAKFQDQSDYESQEEEVYQDEEYEEDQESKEEETEKEIYQEEQEEEQQYQNQEDKIQQEEDKTQQEVQHDEIIHKSIDFQTKSPQNKFDKQNQKQIVAEYAKDINKKEIFQIQDDKEDDLQILQKQNTCKQAILIDEKESQSQGQYENKGQNLVQFIKQHVEFLEKYQNQFADYFNSFNNNKKSKYNNIEFQNLLDKQKYQLLDYVTEMLEYEKEKLCKKYPSLKTK